MSIEGACAEMMEYIIKKLEQVPLAVLDVLFHPLAVTRVCFYYMVFDT